MKTYNKKVKSIIEKGLKLEDALYVVGASDVKKTQKEYNHDCGCGVGYPMCDATMEHTFVAFSLDGETYEVNDWDDYWAFQNDY